MALLKESFLQKLIASRIPWMTGLLCTLQLLLELQLLRKTPL